MLSRIMVTGSQTAISQSHAKYPITDNGFHYWVLHDCHNIQGGPEKTAQTLMRYNFSTAGHRVTRFPAKCSETNW